MSTITSRRKQTRPSWVDRLTLRLQHGDVIFRALTFIAALVILLTLLAIGFALWQSTPLAREKFGFGFLISDEWDPVQEKFGALPMIYGTLQTSLLALILALPLGLGIAIFLSELAPSWLRAPLGYMIELLAAVPSVVYGLWALYVYVPIFVKPTAQALNSAFGFLPLFAGPVFGPSRLAAALILTIMILPTISALCRDVFRAIPSAQREAALALGATQWEMIWQVLIPYGLSGILGAAILGLGRALGETVAVTMVIGNNHDLSASLLHPGYTMASIIANEFTEATSEVYLQALIEVALVLFAITLVLNLIARWLVWSVARRTPNEMRA